MLECWDLHEMTSITVSCSGWRFKLLDQNPDNIYEDDYVDLSETYVQTNQYQ